MKLYGISGLGADKRVFQELHLDCNLFPLEWITPKENESLKAYSLRLGTTINKTEDFGIVGVSFGGLVAVEMSKRLNPKLTILISSVQKSVELRGIYRLMGKTRIIKLIPMNWLDPPRVIANFLFTAENKELLNEILNDTDLEFTKWALDKLMTWENSEAVQNHLLQINGTADKLIPPRKSKSMKVVKGGGHFMIVDKADEISQMINEEIELLRGEMR